MGHIPDGVFNFIGNTIEILSAPERTIDELNLLAKILRDTQEKRLNQEEIAARVKQELPSLSRLTQLLPTNRSELYGFLMLVLVVIQLLTQSQQTKPPVSTITVNQVVQAVYVQSTASAQQPYKGIGKTGRNDLCPCGSGKKYKKCCGAAQ
jgi:preprotein translocase subunit SecA